MGDLILLPKDTRIPADLIVLSSSEPDGSTFMETSTLDGEKNLKPRYSLKETYDSVDITLEKKLKSQLKKNEIPYKGNFSVDYHLKLNVQQPSPSLYQFEGYINEITDDLSEGKKLPIGSKNFLFKGAMIRNVDWTLGVVIYSGNDTKIQQNGAEARFKVSTMESKLHKMIIILFLLQLILSFLAVIVKFIYVYNIDFEFDEYLNKIGEYETDSLFLVFMRYFILLNSLIPISLIVNLEMVRLVQAYFIGKSLELKNIERNM